MFTDKLKKIRKAKKLTQTQLAELCGISRNSIVNWETGKSTPKVADIEKLSMILGISPHELMGGVTEKQQEEKVNNEPKGYAYWGGVVDEARRAAERGDEVEMHYIEPLLHLAYELLSSGIKNMRKGKTKMPVPSVSAYNGDHSSYMGNSLTVEAMA